MHGIRVAEALALRGRRDEAFAALRQTMDALERDQSILTRLWFFQHEMRMSPFLGSLHADTRWAKLMAMPTGDSAAEIIERLWRGERTAAVRG